MLNNDISAPPTSSKKWRRQSQKAPMLPYHFYFETLASIGDTQSEEWRSITASLIVLRLIDDWLDLGPLVVTPDSPQLIIAQTLVEQLPKEKHLRPILERIIVTLERVHSSIQAAAPAMFAYVEHMHDSGNLLLAQEVLKTLQTRATDAKDDELSAQASLQLGYVLRKLGQFDLAAESYNIADYYARKTNNIPSILYARGGNLKILATRGDLTNAETEGVDVYARAESIGSKQNMSLALQDQGFVAMLANNVHESIPLFRKSLQYAQKCHEFVAIDLATALVPAGFFEEARVLNLRLALLSDKWGVKTWSTLNLMELAILEEQPSIFEWYRLAIQLKSLDPMSQVWYHRLVALGYSRFGTKVQEMEELQKAYSLAEKHGIGKHCLVY